MSLFELNDEQQQVLDMVRDFCKKEIEPVARELEHNDEYPKDIVNKMMELGFFGFTIPEKYGGIGLDYVTYSLVVEELTSHWMSISGIINSHLIMAYIIQKFGTEDQKNKFLPKLATGECRGGLALSEADAGTDVQNMSTKAEKSGDSYIINGSKMWITNARHGNTFILAAKTDTEITPKYKGISLFIIEKGHEGFQVQRDIDKLGYKGVKTCEIVFDNFEVPADKLIGGHEGRGFKQVLGGLELGRVNVAARGLGLARAAFEDSIRYAQERKTFGKPICEHQAIQLKLGEMGTKLEAAKLLTVNAAMKLQKGERSDLEAGMAKLFATEAGFELSSEAMRIHGGYGYTKEFDVERYYRDAPLMLIGEGTNEMQRIIISKGLVNKYSI
ncbi:acyl-CoA dehydrogenase family protein [Virgibacillus litoralis]|uniref:Alkylation response protein AidB-like acyl-CoA dehydrogenase n=1 Tax=Virgibacillus litoralis TaxID=578221 RepID=A0ABS4H9I4_9BACI|nr:acyl-CoA dehydrogenase family protein [Virgibacillus litoralis]MBP1947087.1 alkylation response protein AidB-like acyl-CoA dehydrogenase [Virgibacillus litoralis]